MEVYISGNYDYYTRGVYVVYVDGEVFDTLFQYAGDPLTFSEMQDMAALYKESLEGWEQAQKENNGTHL